MYNEKVSPNMLDKSCDSGSESKPSITIFNPRKLLTHQSIKQLRDQIGNIHDQIQESNAQLKIAVDTVIKDMELTDFIDVIGYQHDLKIQSVKLVPSTKYQTPKVSVVTDKGNIYLGYDGEFDADCTDSKALDALALKLQDWLAKAINNIEFN